MGHRMMVNHRDKRSLQGLGINPVPSADTGRHVVMMSGELYMRVANLWVATMNSLCPDVLTSEWARETGRALRRSQSLQAAWLQGPAERRLFPVPSIRPDRLLASCWGGG
jgi:hypothetical protein